MVEEQRAEREGAPGGQGRRVTGQHWAARASFRPKAWKCYVFPAAPVAVIQVVGTHFATAHAHGAPLAPGAFALLIAGPAALLARRQLPVPTLAVVFAITLAYELLGYPAGPVWLALIVAFLAVATQPSRNDRTLAWISLALGYPTFEWAVPVIRGHHLPSAASALGVAAWMAALGAVAEVTRVRHQRCAEVARLTAEEDLRRAGEERLGIARELHDVLAHHISLINVQAGVGLDLMDDKPEQARIALVAIKHASKDALGELRSVLDILRRPDESAPRRPSPSLAQLDELVARTRGPDLSVSQVVLGAPRPLPAGIELAAYRIVQEALTNAARHAGPACAVIRLRYGPEDLLIEVDDDGRSGSGEQAATATATATATGNGNGNGNGLRGMRERAVALGGWLEAGPRPEGGFSVQASLPLHP